MADEQSSPKKRVGFIGWLKRLLLLVVLVAAGGAGFWYYQMEREAEILQGIIERLTAEARVADVWVEEITKDEAGGAEYLKLKILQYDVDGKPLQPVYCTFSLNNVIHFEALVIRLNDEVVKGGEGKSIHLFRRAFALDDNGNTYEACVLNKPDEVPDGYRLAGGDPRAREIERRHWRSFWKYALDEERRQAAGVKNAQIEAPATRFVPDKIYQLRLEADGGLYIKASPVPEILKGEHVRIHAPKKPEGTP